MEFAGTPVIVLGMRRSGTSYLTSFLSSNGVDLGSDLLTPAAANPRGFFEDSEIVAFHQGILRRLGTTPDWDHPAGELLPHQDLTTREKGQALRILQRLAKPGLWGWKDPRTIHFIGFWLELLPKAKIIVPLRHPLEIRYSYLKQIATIDLLIDIKRIFRAYAQHHQRTLRIVQERPRQSLVVYAQNAFSNPQALRDVLEDFLELPANGSRPKAPTFEESEFTRLCIHRDATQIFATLLPEAAAAFDKLNQCAHFSFRPSEAAPELREVSAQLAAAVCVAGSPATPESWLPLLIDLCRSSELPGYFSLQAALLTSHAEAARFWKAQYETISKELESHAALVREQSAWIGQLQEANRSDSLKVAAGYSRKAG